ncbi:hypothetical protein [Pseudokordiimonas caeni]|uniref:hypothetical protein n=1 Tax=Pseudokordiimonas caeni TaxID=2997908 RepID=UPI00281126A6|nr:hypothetical protein [Pseudokordiimonas caeni]
MLGVSANVHYEIMGRRSSRWAILGVMNDRNEAMAHAEKAWGTNQFNGVKIIRESFDPATQAFATVEIFSRGVSRKASKYDQTGSIAPCLTPDDLYSADGRRSLHDLLHTTLHEWNLTPTEILHSLEHYYRLYNTGTKLQNAVQHTAISLEADQGSVQERMRKLYKVIDLAVAIMENEKGNVPKIEADRLKQAIEEVEAAPNRRFLLACAITEYLRPLGSMNEKLRQIVGFLSPDRPAWVMDILDQFISELLLHDRVITSLLIEGEDRGDFMAQIAWLQAGQLHLNPPEDGKPQYDEQVLLLSGFLATSSLPQTARSLFERLRLEIESSKPLNKKGLLAQLASVDRLRQAVEALKIDISAADALDEALKSRSSRLINTQIIGEMVYDIKDPFAQIEFLLEIEALVVGMTNKRMIANFILPILTRADNETVFLGLGGQPLKVLPKLTAMQAKVKSADLSEMHRRKICEKLDEFGRTILENTQVLKRLHQLDIPAQEKAAKLLTMLADGYFTDGEARDRAELQARHYMKSPGFTEGLIAGLGRADAEKALLNFRTLLSRANITKEDDS